MGGELDAQYSVYKNRTMELLLDLQGKAEYDSHVMDLVGTSHATTVVSGTGGAIVRF